jgi:hypothetical protein
MLAHMADWRQIQARIRKAKASPDAPAQLAELYERTRDAMVALELAQWHEKAGDNGEAVRWYTAAAERFRRAQWRTKAEEALTRLGAAIPTYTSEAVPEPKSADARAARRSANANAAAAAAPTVEKGADKTAEKTAESAEEAALETAGGPSSDAEESPAETAAQTGAEGDPASKKRRRRGRRGGRKRRSGSGAAQAQSGSANTAGAGGAAAAVPLGSRQAGGLGGATFPNVSPAAELSEPHRREFGGAQSRPSPPQTGAGQHSSVGSVAGAPAAEEPSPVAAPLAERDVSPPQERGYESAPAPSWQGRTRAGEPALASRISQLESQLRRLLACPLGSLDDADLAPAGPGVLLLSDSDQVTHYYIESCQTLRIGIGNLLRGGRGSKDSGLLKARMAENLGIAELRVSRYLKEHCAVRWLQLDEGAPELAHFAIAVLRPVVNE